jgi:toxin CptA
MHAAPSVSYPVGRGRIAAWLLALPWAAGCGAVLAWSWQSAAPGGWRAGAFLLLAACGAWAAAAWWRAPRGTLAWTGAGWRWQDARPGRAQAEEEGRRPQAALDLQAALLLRWQAPGRGARWLWLERNAAPADWDALRRAVYSRANDTAPHGAPPPVA